MEAGGGAQLSVSSCTGSPAAHLLGAQPCQAVGEAHRLGRRQQAQGALQLSVT